MKKEMCTFSVSSDQMNGEINKTAPPLLSVVYLALFHTSIFRESLACFLSAACLPAELGCPEPIII